VGICQYNPSQVAITYQLPRQVTIPAHFEQRHEDTSSNTSHML